LNAQRVSNLSRCYSNLHLVATQTSLPFRGEVAATREFQKAEDRIYPEARGVRTA